MPSLSDKFRVPNKKSRNFLSLTSVLTHMMMAICGLYIGFGIGFTTDRSTCPDVPKNEPFEIKMTKEEWRKKFPQIATTEEIPSENSAPKFPDTLKRIVNDYSTVPRDDFNELLEVGVPMDETKEGSEEVFVLYTDPKTLPNKKGKKKEKDRGVKHGLDAERALENCHTVKVILQEPVSAKGKPKRQCIAIVPQWESFHVHKFMRMPDYYNGIEVDVKYPLRYVSRLMLEKGKGYDYGIPIWKKHIRPSYDALVDYVEHFDTSLKELEPLTKNAMKKFKSAGNISDISKKSNTMVVMVCNKGQSHLFHNFVCNARAKGIDLNRIIMFATDEYTHKLSQDLGIASIYDEEIFRSMPENAAGHYGDEDFAMMMMAKIYCVHLTMSLGYDVLFQDVDVIWQKDPVEYIESESKEWDMFFQDDGSRNVLYQPWSPNTGFYFVRNNDITTYFFNSLLKKNDLVMYQKSHQVALTAQLQEFVSWKGMRVKTWPKMGDTLFPGGCEFHNGKEYMKKMIAGEIKPYIFHMSWTENKDNKKLHYKQMGEWYLKNKSSGCNGFDCCVAEPIISCHYRDKPSVIPCHDSPFYATHNQIDFWDEHTIE